MDVVDQAKTEWIKQAWDIEIRSINDLKTTQLEAVKIKHDAKLKKYKDTYTQLVKSQTELWKKEQNVIIKQHENNINDFLKSKLNNYSLYDTLCDYMSGLKEIFIHDPNSTNSTNSLTPK